MQDAPVIGEVKTCDRCGNNTMFYSRLNGWVCDCIFEPNPNVMQELRQLRREVAALKGIALDVREKQGRR